VPDYERIVAYLAAGEIDMGLRLLPLLCLLSVCFDGLHAEGVC
jgi:hypothetical protein